MSWPMVAVGKIAEVKGGGTPSKSRPDFYQGEIPWVTPKDMKFWQINTSIDRITEEAVASSATNLVPANSVLLVNRSGILKHTLPVGVAQRPVAINQDIKALIFSDRCDPQYAAHIIKASERIVLGWVRATTADNFPIQNLKDMPIPFPPLVEQRRIAGILDAADALRRHRREALALLDTLPGAIFAEMFGDDPYSFDGMESASVADVVSLISDGPFGSNLKSSHYVEDGVRVARLQNIGIGEFNDSDQAFISPEHAKKLSRNKCFPGDVLVATLGDPNVRACVVPESIPELINKADVVRIIPDDKKVLSKFLVCLLNLPVTQSHIQSLVLGQTRGRVSMGRLKTLRIPTPPIAEQKAFVDRIEALEEHRLALRNQLSELETLFASLQSRAFAGEL